MNGRVRLWLAAGLASSSLLVVAACGTSSSASRGVVPNVLGKRLGVAETTLRADGLVVVSLTWGGSVPETVWGSSDTLASRILGQFRSLRPEGTWIVCEAHPAPGNAALRPRTTRHAAAGRYGVSLVAERSCPK
jgi:hypothetical protein